jgi:Zn-dependent protease
MTTCSLCGKEDLCFTCPYCKGVFCGDHRLPEGHGCPAMHQVRADAKRKVSKSLGADDYEDNQTWASVMPKKNAKKPVRKSKRRRFSSTELRDLLISCVLVTLVSLSILGEGFGIGIMTTLSRLASYFSSPLWWIPVGMIVIFLLSFIGHELAHKFTAQHYGMWSEFRMTTMGYYLSAMAILFAIPIFGTGTVYTSGTTNTEQDAKTNLAGPMSNFVIAISLVAVAIFSSILFVEPYYILFLVQYGVIINAILGLFNMIPFQPFDGGTVRQWSLPVWITLTVALVSMLAIGWLVIPILM